ncbi:MAG: homoserine dehydrogenase [Alphaproteobacteria bacterium]|nr:homoserine dehydrogenase [Alphaproteobacteria bacterium]
MQYAEDARRMRQIQAPVQKREEGNVLNIAIVGMGRVGTQFLQELLPHAHKGLSVMCISEMEETPGKDMARRRGIRIMTVEEIIGMGESIDVIFDLTGNGQLRRLLRESMVATRNTHTVIASETIAQLVWCLVTDKSLADHHGHTGY